MYSSNRPVFWSATSKKREKPGPSEPPRIRCPLAGGRCVKKTSGFVPAGMSGTHSTPEECAPPACTSGLKPSAYLVAAGRRIRIGTPIRENDDLSNECGEAVLESLAGSTAMPFIDTSALEVVERLPGWYGRYFHSPSMTFAHYDFKRGSSIHEHFHPQEEVYEVIEGELELTIDGVRQVARPGLVGIVPSNVRHSVKALTDGRAIIVDYPLRTDMGERRS
jgi:quercetin dioxygenase-like cupin family protein